MGYWDIVRKVVANADIVMEILDARFPSQSRNEQLENLVKERGKKLVLILNKSDLISKKWAQEIKDGMKEETVFISAKKRKGFTILKKTILRLSGYNETKIAVTGYPNTGKSSIINMLCGKKSAPTSPTAGFTKGMQNIRINSKIILIDTPGVIPVDDHDETKMVLLASKNVQSIKDLESTGADVAEIVLKNNKEGVENFYGVSASEGYELLEKIAFARKKLLKGARPDMNAAARILITDFQRGMIKVKKTENLDNA